MKNGPLFFIGLFAAISLSWAGIVLTSHLQLGSLTPYFDVVQSQTFPQRLSGIAARGQLVYGDLGCAACHTQQVRRPDFGSDQERGWGDRQSVARDYLFESRPQLGASRLGPDLTNYGARAEKAGKQPADLYEFLYLGSAAHPSYSFLFDEEEIAGQRSIDALSLEGQRSLPRNHQVVPTERAHSLVAYLLSLKTTYDYPESRPVAQPTEAPPVAGPVPEKIPVTPIPAAAPDEKKAEPKK